MLAVLTQHYAPFGFHAKPTTAFALPLGRQVAVLVALDPALFARPATIFELTDVNHAAVGVALNLAVLYKHPSFT